MSLFGRNYKTFLKAAASGDVEELNHCLNNLATGGYSVNVTNGNGETALLLAARNGHVNAVKALLSAKPDLEAAEADGNTALLLAIKNEKSAVARLLIAAGADVNTHDQNYVSALLEASSNGDLDVVKDLVAGRADLNAVSNATGRTPLHWAVDGEYGPVVEFLMAAGARTDIVDRKGKTAVDVAREKDPPGILKLMESAQRPSPAVAGGAETAPNAETWLLLGEAKAAHIGEYPVMNRKITEIFNFATRERLIITENLKTGLETATPAEPFDKIPEAAVRAATAAFTRLGGETGPKSPLSL